MNNKFLKKESQQSIKNVHRGVGVIITNQKKDRFYFQLKDETYSIPELRLNYTVFGGHCDNGEEEYASLQRELKEELDADVAKLIGSRAHFFATHYIIPKIGSLKGADFIFTLFEAVLTDKELSHAASLPIFEGKEGNIIARADLLNIPFGADLKVALIDYANKIERKTIKL